jgi:hypothetical protein
LRVVNVKHRKMRKVNVEEVGKRDLDTVFVVIVIL